MLTRNICRTENYMLLKKSLLIFFHIYVCLCVCVFTDMRTDSLKVNIFTWCVTVRPYLVTIHCYYCIFFFILVAYNESCV